jgi:hypothetical protein
MRRKHSTWWLGGLTACALLVAAAGQARASYIDTTSLWNHKSSVGPFGDTTSTKKYAATTYGETFLVGPKDTELMNFTFWMRDSKKAGPVTLEGVIMQWDGTKAVGSPVWTSTPVTVSKTGPVNFKTGGLQLDPNTKYVAFITTSPFTNSGNPGVRVGYVGKNDYPQGQFVYLNNGSDLSKLTTTAWHHAPHGNDLAFRARLVDPAISSTPAPPGLLLGAIGSCGLVAGAWRGRRKKRA